MKQKLRSCARTASVLALLTGIASLSGMGPMVRATPQQNPPPDSQKPKGKPTPSARPAAEPQTQKQGFFDGSGWKHDEQTQTGSMRDFTYREGPMTITGQFVRYDDKKKALIAEGNLVLNDNRYHITADKADVNYGKSKSLAILTGKTVVITLKPSDNGETTNPNAPPDSVRSREETAAERKNPVVITCQSVENHYKKEFIVLRGNLLFKQTITRKRDGKTIERTMTAAYAEYDGKKEQLTLYPPVKGSDTLGQEIAFEDKVIVGTREGAETLESAGKITLRLNAEETESEDEVEERLKTEAKEADTLPKDGEKRPEPKPNGKPEEKKSEG
jgi:lipopolysaccharide export system protein LptA